MAGQSTVATDRNPPDRSEVAAPRAYVRSSTGDDPDAHAARARRGTRPLHRPDSASRAAVLYAPRHGPALAVQYALDDVAHPRDGRESRRHDRRGARRLARSRVRTQRLVRQPVLRAPRAPAYAAPPRLRAGDAS